MAAMMSRGMLLPSLTSRVNPMPKKNKDPAAVRILPPATNKQRGFCVVLLSVLNGPAVWDVLLLSRPGRGVFFRLFRPLVTGVPFSSISMGAAS